mgnify:CR=1 FL=1
MSYRYLLLVDPSLTCSGWALFALKSGHLKAVGKINSIAAKFPLSVRLQDLQSKISIIYQELNLNSKDIVICESPTTMRDPKAAIKVEQVRSIFETLARGCGMLVPGRINPRSVQNEILGIKGRQIKRSSVKEIAVDVVCKVYGKHLKEIGFPLSKENLKKNQDIVDAILIGSLGVARIFSANQCGVDPALIFQNSQATRSGRVMAR